MATQESPIDPCTCITQERLEHVLTILKGAQDERAVVRQRVKSLTQELVRLLDEIEQFETIVYCGEAAACLLVKAKLDYDVVLRVLAGSVTQKTRICKDEFWHAPSPAAAAVLDRGSANGREEWKDRFGRSINTITKRATDPTKARKVKQHS